MKCAFCPELFEPTKKHQKYCSRICCRSHWIENNPERYNASKKKWRQKKQVACRECGKNVPLSERKAGVVFCSEECRLLKQKNIAKQYRSNRSEEFMRYKESLGCVCCGYNFFGGSLDYHHVDPAVKEMRVTARVWKTGSAELKKCILVCKNCHYRLHYIHNTDPNLYEKLMLRPTDLVKLKR